MKEIVHLAELKDTYTTFVFPIYGVLHDSISVNRDTHRVLVELYELNKTVVIFTNVPHRRQRVITELMSMGIAPPLYQHVITAGEETWQHLKNQHDPFHASLGDLCYYIGSTDDLDILKGLPCHRVSSLDQADFILAMGADEWHGNIESYYELLKEAIARQVPMVCGDPDQYVRYDNQRTLRAGAIAEFYRQMGGNVYYHGKPYREFYYTLLKELAPISKSNILLIGDSIYCDVKGAHSVGLDCLMLFDLTTYDELFDDKNDVYLDKITLDQIFAKTQKIGYSPQYMIRKLKW